MNRIIPDIVVGRLPIYLRALQRMSEEGRQITSSLELGERLGISSAQIRKDLSQFGEFGKQGTGYNIEFLVRNICKILKIDRVWDMAVVGAGDIGSAIARYQGFTNRGFQVTLIFDIDPTKIGTRVGEFTVQDFDSMVDKLRRYNVKVGMIAVPGSVAQEVADRLIEGGVKAILNYAPINISVPQDVRLQYIDPVIHLQRMTYYM
jgi:redox-sensing transcriptional repressor